MDVDEPAASAEFQGDPGAVVTGCACMVQSVEEEFKLAYYETNAYDLALCEIHFTNALSGKENGESVVGRTFKYAGDAQTLKKGRFDRTLWEVQRRLPPAWRTATRRDAEREDMEKKMRRRG
ncbi:hypothetical protein C8A03DRAFT_17871 [Achaetomium macrosporum]|uniref:Uncharacterized protein n=1 Tax=Achaetomium macrosporum TaxID=79813 RepID=A0AAN7C4S6_9PEZI|nr:hypothetical protein C8A03DRAFT_17871 [Achaetomium macrosporum]